MGQDNYKQATEHYQKAEKTLYDYLGVTPSEELRGLYETIIKKTHRHERDIVDVQNELMEESNTGAFVCEYSAFKRIYCLQARQGARMGISVFLLLTTLSADEGIAENKNRVLRDAMVHLEDVLRTSALRPGGPVQQLPVCGPAARCQYETAQIVAGRIEKAFWSNYKNRQLQLRFDLDELHYD